MKRFIFVIPAFFLIGYISSLDQAFSQTDYTTYYSLTSRAKECQVQNKIDSAIYFYDSAFSIGFPYTEDLLDRIKCYEQSDQNDHIYPALQELILCGYKFREETPAYNKEKRIVYSFSLEDKILFTKIELEYDSLRQIFLSKQDLKSNEIMRVFRAYANTMELLKKSLKGEDTIAIVRKMGDRMIGAELMFLLRDSSYTLFRSQTDFWNDPYFLASIVCGLRAYADDSSKKQELLSLLQKQVWQGNLYPNTHDLLLKACGEPSGEDILYRYVLAQNDLSDFISKKTSQDIKLNNYSEYYKWRNQALTSLAEKKYEQAAVQYEEAFRQAFPFAEDMRKLLECYHQINQPEKEYHTLQRLILCGFKLEERNGILNPKRMHFEDRISILKTSPELLRKMQLEYDSLRTLFLQGVDNENTNYLQVLVSMDCLGSITRTYPEMQMIADKNFFFAQAGLELIYLLENGFDFNRKIRDNGDGGFLESALVHASKALGLYDSAQACRFLELLFEQVQEGNYSSFAYATLCDLVDWMQGRELTYGTLVYSNRRHMKVKDVKNIDQRRAEIFLPSLWVNDNLYGYKLPKGYKVEK